MSKRDKNENIDEITKIVNSVKKDKEENPKDPIFFVVGILLLIVGLFILSRKVMVSMGWGSFGFLNYNFTSGLLIIPLIIGIIWLFYNPKSLMAKLLCVVGVILVVVAIIMSIHIHLLAMTLFDYIVIIGMIAAGLGSLLRYYFSKN